MLAFRPRDGEDERGARISSAPPIGIEREFKQLRVTQPIGFGWMASDLTAAGVAGDASNATAEKGEACADYAAPPSSICCATCWRSISPGSGRGRWR